LDHFSFGHGEVIRRHANEDYSDEAF
jgi:hypothetical protein